VAQASKAVEGRENRICAAKERREGGSGKKREKEKVSTTRSWHGKKETKRGVSDAERRGKKGGSTGRD